jgi:REP element-mobilizing transposase RayT
LNAGFFTERGEWSASVRVDIALCRNISARELPVASTYLSLYYHLVFGTKNREPLIAPQWRCRLHEYLGGTISGLGGFSQGIGGVADHVHLFVGLKATHCLADFLRELKKASSAWVHEKIGLPSFAWQEGYAAFTVSATVRGAVRSYIADQEEHHRLKPFREELVEMLHKAEIEFDTKYLD